MYFFSFNDEHLHVQPRKCRLLMSDSSYHNFKEYSWNIRVNLRQLLKPFEIKELKNIRLQYNQVFESQKSTTNIQN